MKVSNVVTSTVVAISAAGTLGLAYAQSYSEPQPGTSAPTRQDATSTEPRPGTTSPTRQDASQRTDRATSGTASQDPSGSMSQDSTGSTGTPGSDSTYNERVARADRN